MVSFFKHFLVLIIWVPTVILWVLFVLGFKLIGKLDKHNNSWNMCNVTAINWGSTGIVNKHSCT